MPAVAAVPEAGIVNPVGLPGAVMFSTTAGAAMRRLLIIGVLVIPAALATSCTATPRHTITGAEALRRAEGYVLETLHAASTELTLARTKAATDYTGGCVKGLSDSDFTGQIEAEVTYTAREVSPESAARYLASVDQYWSRQWGEVQRGPEHLNVATDDRDHYQLYATYSPDSQELDVGGTSPCVWLNGTPGPTDNP